MRIAYMLTSLGIGGAERQVTALAERMAQRGHDVVLLVLRPRQEHEFQTGVKVLRLETTKSPLGVAWGLLRGERLLRDFAPDLVHSHTFPANMAARILHLTGAAPAVLSTIHNICEGGWQRTLAYRLTDALSVHTAAVSRAVAGRYVQIGAVPENKCSVISNGIDVERFDPARAQALRDDRLRCGPGEFIWLAAGRNVPAKDFNNLLAAFKLVCAEEPGVYLCIAGEHAAIDRQCVDASRVRWLGLCDDMPAIMLASDALVLSSAWEGMPLVVGEAMAMEKPVVATGVGGIRELVGDTGVVVPPKDSQELAAAMLRVMRMPEVQRRQMKSAARERIVKRFAISDKVREWEALYSELLSEVPPKAASHVW